MVQAGRERTRVVAGREPTPRAAGRDSPAVQTTEMGGRERGEDGGKHMQGRKRQGLVETWGWLLAILIPRAGRADGAAAPLLLGHVTPHDCPRLPTICADQQYHTQALDAWMAAHRAGGRIAVQARPAGAWGFIPRKPPWGMARPNAWHGRYRRHSKDYGRTTASSTAMRTSSPIHLRLNRLAPSDRPAFHDRTEAACSRGHRVQGFPDSLSVPKRGPKCKLGYYRVFNLILRLLYTGMQWKCLPVPTASAGKPAIHYTTIYKVFAQWADNGSLGQAFVARVRHLVVEKQLDLSVLHGDGTNTVAKKGGDGIGYPGHKHQKGEKVIAIIANNGYVLAPVPVAPVNETDMVLLPDGLKALKRVAKEVGLDLRGAYLNLDGGFDSARNRQCLCNAGLIPHSKENPRNRKTTKRGRKRLFNEAIHVLRMRVERTFAGEDKFKRLLLRFERIQQRHYGMKLMAYTLINLWAFCGI